MLNYKVYDNQKKDWIVFIHGIGGSILTWKKQIEPFSERYNLLLLDLPGHGLSKYDKLKKINKREVNENIKEVLDFLGIQKADFVGMSLGSLVIAQFAVKYPEYINAIVFGGAVIRVDGIFKWLMNTTNTIKRFLPYRLTYNIFAHIMMPKKNHKKSRMFFIRESLKIKRESFMEWIDYMSIISHSQKLLEKLKKLNISILFISGDEDICFIKGTKKVADFLTKSKIKIIEKCGHVCTIEKAKEFNRYALNFLQMMHPTIALPS